MKCCVSPKFNSVRYSSSFICIVILTLFFTQNVNALQPLPFPDPDLILYSMPAPEFDTESGLLKGEIIIKNRGGEQINQFAISAWVEGLEQQTKVTVYGSHMPGYGYTRSYTYHFNLNNFTIFTPGRYYYVIAEMDNKTIRSRNPFLYDIPSYFKPNLTFDTSQTSINRYDFNPLTNEISLFNNIINNGGTATGSFYVTWYLSEDQNITTGDIEIQSHEIPDGLTSQESIQLNKNFDIDDLSSLQAGNYYIGILIDNNSQITESWEDDNDNFFGDIFPWGGATGPINLGFSSIDSDHSWLFGLVSHDLSISNIIVNTGTSSSGEFRVSRYLFSNSIGYIFFDSAIINQLSPSQSIPISNTRNLDTLEGLQNGWYSIIVFIDDLKVVSETDENDNFGSFTANAAPTLFEYNDSTKPNLSIYYYPEGGCYVGMEYFPETHEIQYVNSIGNFGRSYAPSFKVGYYLSSDENISPNEDIWLFSWDFGFGLDPFRYDYDKYVKNINLDDYIPYLPAGTYFFGFYIDDEFTVDEFDENDNSFYFAGQNQIIEWSGPIFHGDIDLDSDADGTDLSNFITLYQSGDLQIDFNNDGSVDHEDLAMFLQNFGYNNSGYQAAGDGMLNHYESETSSTLITNDTIENLESETILIQSTYENTNTIVLNLPSTEKTIMPTQTSNFSVIEKPTLNSNETKLAIEETTSDDNSIVTEVNWSSSDGQRGIVIGSDWEWKIEDINIVADSNQITLEVKDSEGNWGKKEIKIITDKLRPLNDNLKNQKWLRRFIYEFKSDIDGFSENPSAVDITLFCWPDRITIIDEKIESYNNDNITVMFSDKLDTKQSYNSEYIFDFELKLNCKAEINNILYLDIPLEAMNKN